MEPVILGLGDFIVFGLLAIAIFCAGYAIGFSSGRNWER